MAIIGDEIKAQDRGTFDKAMETTAQKPRALASWQSKSGALMLPVELCTPDVDVRDQGDDEEDREFEAGIAELHAKGSGIEATGLDTPVSARPHSEKPGHYLIYGGRRRFRSAAACGNLFVPATLKQLSDADAFAETVRENVARRSISEVAEGDAYLKLQAEGWSLSQIARRVAHKSQGYVTNRLRAAKQDADLKAMIAARKGTMSHADVIAEVKPGPERVALIKRVVEEKASLPDVLEAAQDLARRGLTYARKQGSAPPSRTHHQATAPGVADTPPPPPKIFVDWPRIFAEMKNSSFRLRQAVEANPPLDKGKRDELLNAMAVMEKDLRQAREDLGAVGSKEGE